MYEWYKDNYSEEEQLLKEIERYEMFIDGKDDYDDCDDCNERCEV